MVVHNSYVTHCVHSALCVNKVALERNVKREKSVGFFLNDTKAACRRSDFCFARTVCCYHVGEGCVLVKLK